MEAQSTNLSYYKNQPSVNENYSMYKVQRMLKFLQSKGHTCSLSVDYSRHANSYKTAEELDTDYSLRFYDGFTVHSHSLDCIEMVACLLTNFINKKGYYYE